MTRVKQQASHPVTRRPDLAVLTRSEKIRLSHANKKLLAWYGEHGRSFPWRQPDASDYQRICVEVLLQRTRAETVSNLFHDFFEAYRSWEAIAQTNHESLETALRPIGLWKRRAASIKGLAVAAAKLDGQFPRSRAKLAQIPAVGQYVANAILLFQHGLRVPLLDTNMARVIERYLRPRKLADIRHDPWLQAAAYWLVRSGNPREVNWAVLDLGAIVCTPGSPSCERCPLYTSCRHRRGN